MIHQTSPKRFEFAERQFLFSLLLSSLIILSYVGLTMLVGAFLTTPRFDIPLAGALVGTFYVGALAVMAGKWVSQTSQGRAWSSWFFSLSAVRTGAQPLGAVVVTQTTTTTTTTATAMMFDEDDTPRQKKNKENDL